MLRMIIIGILISSVLLIGFSQEENSQKLFSFKSNAKCGYINKTGKIVIPPQFDYCDRFREGLAQVSLFEKSGYIDETGKIVISLQFDYFLSEPFYEGFASITLPINEKGIREQGYVDKLGIVRFLEGVSETYSFYDGLAEVKKNGKSGFIDKNMNFAIAPKFDFVRSFSDGRAWVSDKNGKSYYIDKKGKKVIENYGSGGSDFSEGLAKFHLKDTRYGYKYGFMDIKGKVVIEPQYGYRCLFNEGLACAEGDNDKWGFIDKTGKFVIESQFDEAEDFSTDGVAVVKVGEKYGFINKQGEFMISPQFDKAYWLEGLGLVEINGKKQYINKLNQTIFIFP